MEYIIVGLGNPGERYKETRHNVGRMIVERLQDKWQTSSWRDDKKLRAKISQGALLDTHISTTLFLPDDYMNRSGPCVAPLIEEVGQIEQLIVVHDDIDLALGTIRISYNKGSGGHNGVSSIERALKTKAFVRIRVGVVPVSIFGKLKKPKGEQKVHSFILKRLSKSQLEKIENAVQLGVAATETVLAKGRIQAMNECNGTMN